MAELTIITQNLNGYLLHRQKGYQPADLENLKKRYRETHKAKIYAFQESCTVRKETKRPNFITETIVVDESLKKDDVSDRAKEIWNKAFPWFDFRAYLDECNIELAGKKIYIINVHCSPTYKFKIRYTLLRSLKEIPNEFTILLGDFNAAFCGIIGPKQTESEYEDDIIESEDFLDRIQNLGFIECMDLEERNGNPHYTHSYISKKDEKLKRNKLDHIFISKSLFDLLKEPYKITYLDEVNRDKHPESEAAFTDHSGIKLTINLPDT